LLAVVAVVMALLPLPVVVAVQVVIAFLLERHLVVGLPLSQSTPSSRVLLIL
jgi:hypothetical protein